MEKLTPSSLSAIDAVEIVDVRKVSPRHVGETMSAATNAPSIRLTGVDADRIGDLWRRLPPGDQARCHIPPFGLRFLLRNVVICEASICWQCSNIFGRSGKDELFFAFDALQADSQALLRECEAALGTTAEE